LVADGLIIKIYSVMLVMFIFYINKFSNGGMQRSRLGR